jgi:acyl-CoA dehydrogenase
MPEPPASAGYPPSPEGRAALAHLRTFLAETALPMCAELEARLPDAAFALEPDGRLAGELVGLKRRMQEASAEAGLYCPHLPEGDGGLGLSLRDCFYLQEEVFRHGLRGQQWSLAWTDGPAPPVSSWSPEARQRYLTDFVAGRLNACFALTEPEAGSDFPALQTSARKDGDGYLLSGRKHLITGAPFAELAQVFARLDGAPRGRLTGFLVPLDTPGVTRGPVQQTIMADGQTGGLVFEEVRLPGWALLGAEHEGLPLAFGWINWARTRRGGMCCGLGRHCLERSLAYASERRAFGRAIAELGAVAHMLADMHMELEAMRALSLELLSRLDAAHLFDGPVTAAERRDVSVLKTWCDEALFRIADLAIQVHGGRGLLTAAGLEKIFRVARNLRIPAGTTEVQRAVIADALAEDGL